MWSPMNLEVAAASNTLATISRLLIITPVLLVAHLALFVIVSHRGLVWPVGRRLKGIRAALQPRDWRADRGVHSEHYLECHPQIAQEARLSVSRQSPLGALWSAAPRPPDQVTQTEAT